MKNQKPDRFRCSMPAFDTRVVAGAPVTKPLLLSLVLAVAVLVPAMVLTAADPGSLDLRSPSQVALAKNATLTGTAPDVPADVNLIDWQAIAILLNTFGSLPGVTDDLLNYAFNLPPAVTRHLVTSVIPTAPVLMATAADGRINLSWTDATPAAKPVPGHPADELGFILQRATNSIFAGMIITFSLPANTTTMTDTTVNLYMNYRYRIFAFNPAGQSPMSNIVTMSSAITHPGAPTGEIATAGKPRATVTFVPPVVIGGNAITVTPATISVDGRTATRLTAVAP